MTAKKKKVKEKEEEKKEVEEKTSADSDDVQEQKDTLEEPATQEESPEDAETPEEEQKAKLSISSFLNKKFIWIGLPAILIIGALIGGIFIYRAGVKSARIVQEEPSPTPLPSPTETAEPSPEPELKREDLKLQVLNGRGVAGTASDAKEFLEGLGYKDVAVGNADSFDFEKTEVSIKEDKKDYLEMLTDDLSKEYVVSEDTETLDAESDFDAVITIGKN